MTPPTAPLADQFARRKADGPRIAALTAYDYPGAKLLDEQGIDLILVGDSVGMVVLGLPDTTRVTMDHMLHHCTAVARGVEKATLVCDLPAGSYPDPETAVANARRLRDAGAHAVKLEGALVAQVEAIVADGIPVMGHLGMLPQHVLEEGGYKIKGKTPEEAARLEREAAALESAGAFAIVLELVKPEIATRISQSLRVPTIGIGSGTECDGQILVTHDLVWLFPWFTPRFVRPAANLAPEFRRAVDDYIRRVRLV
jgi:3-methyl-2-oxobutanoate hydroxymethyltransferase